MAATSKKLGIGIIGSGGIAQSQHMPGYARLPEHCEIVAVADSNRETAREAAEKFKVKHVFSDYHDLLNLKDVDAVSVCTPNYLHLQPTIDALQAGKHVLCEKPLAKNGAEARKMMQAAKETGKLLQVALQWRFTGVAQTLKKYIDSGHMGEMYFARAQALRRRGIPGWGVFIDKAKQGGGPLVDIGVHILDFTLYLMGYPKPISCSGVTYQKFGKRGDVVGLLGQWDYKNFTVEDFAVGFIRFDNGATIVLESSFCANIPESEIFQTQILGTKSGFSCVPYDLNSVKIASEENMQLYDSTPRSIPNINAYHAEVEAFVNSVATEKPSLVPGEQGFVLNAIFDALYTSAESGKEELVDVTF